MPVPSVRTWLLGYRDVFATRRLRRIVFSSAIARLPKGMAPLSLVVLVHDAGHAYTVAGTVAALLAVGDAVATPWQGRLIDAHGPGRVLLPSAFLHVGALCSLVPLAGAPPGVLAATAFAAGVGLPPVSGCVKAAWPGLVGPGRSSTAYAVESLVQQLVFLVGPLLVTVAVATVGPAGALFGSAACGGGGTAWFVVALGRVARPQRGEVRRRVAAVRVLVLVAAGQGAVFGGIPVVVAAVAGPAAGVLQAAVTVGGLVGTAWPTAGGGVRRHTGLSAGFAVALLLVLAATPVGPVAVGLGLGVAGVFVTPVAVAAYGLVAAATGDAGRTEAFTWLSTGQAVGSAAGSALLGALLTAGGPVVAVAAMPVAAGCAAALSLFLWRGHDGSH